MPCTIHVARLHFFSFSNVYFSFCSFLSLSRSFFFLPSDGSHLPREQWSTKGFPVHPCFRIIIPLQFYIDYVSSLSMADVKHGHFDSLIVNQYSLQNCLWIIANNSQKTVGIIKRKKKTQKEKRKKGARKAPLFCIPPWTHSRTNERKKERVKRSKKMWGERSSRCTVTGTQVQRNGKETLRQGGTRGRGLA